MRSYLLAATPRTGSIWLCRRLTAAGLGCPGEHLIWLLRAEDYSPVNLHAAWQIYAQNGIYAVKLFMEPAERQLHLDDVLPPGPRAFIHLTRDDREEQARSLAIAYRYGGWFGHSDRDLEITDEKLAWCRANIAEANEEWERWFDRYGIDPLRVTYEQSVEDSDAVDARIMRWVMEA